MTVTKDNWYQAFTENGSNDVVMNTTTSSGGNTGPLKIDLDTALRNVVDPVTGYIRILVTG